MKNQTTAYQHKDIYENAKKYDVNALRAFMFESTEDITSAISYWEQRAAKLVLPGDEPKKAIIHMEIFRLESILLAKSQLTVDFFNIANLSSVMADSEAMHMGVMSIDKETNKEEVNIAQNKEITPSEDKRWGIATIKGMLEDVLKGKSIEETKEFFKKALIGTVIEDAAGSMTEIKDSAAFEKFFAQKIVPLINKDGKTIQMLPDKIKQTDLIEKCRNLLIEGKDKEAKELANKYLLSGNYIPKKEHAKADKWHDARIEGWLTDIRKSIKPTDKKADTSSGKTDTKNPNPSSTAGEKQEKKPGAEQVTAETANSTKKESETAQNQTDNKPESADLSISIEDYDKFINWLKEIGLEPENVLGKDLFEEFKIPANREKYGSVVCEFSNPEEIIKLLKEKGIDAIYFKEEEEEEDSNSEVSENLFFNESNTLTEEIQHIENLIKLTMELRGDKAGEPQNMDKVEELANVFFSKRSAEDYEPKEKFIGAIKSRPAIVSTAKDFISHMSYGKLEQFFGVDPTDDKKKTTDCYYDICEEVKTLSKEADFETVQLPLLVKKLKGKILSGKTSDGKQVVNKVMFYTTYHVLHFIDQIVQTAKAEEEAKSGEASASASDTAAKNASTSPEAGASKKPTGKEDKSSKEQQKASVDIVESTILDCLKNEGVYTDTLTHPEIVKLKGQTIADPWSAGKITLTAENYSKFLTYKWNEVMETYKEMQTEYPVYKMASLISDAVSSKQSVEDFVKEHIGSIKKKNGTFLTITGKLDDIVVNIPIKSEEDFVKYVKDTYALEEKIHPAAVVYELSEFDNFLDFENKLRIEVTEKKKTLEEVCAWAKEKILNKTFKSENGKDPVFRTDNEKNLAVWIETLTKKLYETPESIAAAEKKITDYATENIKTTELTLLAFVNQVKRFCIESKIDISLKHIQNDIVIPLAKELNPKLYEKYEALHKDLKKSGMIADTTMDGSKKASDTKPEEKKKVIVETSKEVKDNAAREKEILEIVGMATTEADLKEALKDYDYEADKVSIIKAVKTIVCDKKQITDLKLSEAEMQEWLKKYYTTSPLANETSKNAGTNQNSDVQNAKTGSEQSSDMTDENAGSATSQNSGTEDNSERKEYTNETFDDLANAKDKQNFQKALKDIVSKFNDSSEARNAICNAIKEGKGSHTVKVAKQNLAETHKMIKKAYENYEEELVSAMV